MADNIPRDPVVNPAEAQDNEQETNSQLRQQIGFGMDMAEFMRTDVGTYLTKRANAEIKEMHRAMEDVDPADANEVRRLQMEIKLRRVWADWIRIAIDEGIAAQQQAVERGVL